MATTIPLVWSGTAALNSTAVAGVIASRNIAQGDCDKADTLEDVAYYSGLVDAYTQVLHVLGLTPVEPVTVKVRS